MTRTLLSLCHTAVRAPETSSQGGGLFICGDAGVMADYGTSYVRKTEVEVLPVVDLSGKSVFQHIFVGDATQVTHRPPAAAAAAAALCIHINKYSSIDLI